MKKLIPAAIFLCLIVSAGTTKAFSQNMQPAAETDKTSPSYDMKGQSLVDLERAQAKFVALAKALPAKKLTWRPAPDARSFAEVFLHVSGERYGILALMGTPLPAGYDGKTYEKSTTDQSKIVEELNKSWEFTKAAITGMSNADFAKPLPKLGPDANAGDVIYILVADAHEHLGQVVAYARVNGVVPPWTVEAEKQAAENKAKQK